MINNLTSAQHSRIEDELYAQEEILWAGTPTPLRALGGGSLVSAGASAGILVLVLGIIFTFRSMAFSGFEGMPMMGPPPAIFTLITLIMALTFGLVLLSPLWQWLNARNTLYAITNQRILILDGVLSQNATSYHAADIERIERRTYGNGRGDIIFRRETRSRRYRTSGGFRRTRYYTQSIGLFGIPDVREVERLIRVTFKGEEGIKPKRKHDDLMENSDADFYMDYEDTLAAIPPGEDPTP